MLKTQARGFTLVEMMISVTIMAILLATVAPFIGSWMVNIRSRGVAESVLAGLQKARIEAIRRNQAVSLWLVASNDPTQFDSSCALSSTAGSWVISATTPAGKCSSNPEIKVPGFLDWYATGKTATNVTIAAKDIASNAASSIKFDPLGHVYSGGNPIRSIDFTASTEDSRRLRILVSSVGSVRLCDRDVIQPDPRAC